MNAAQMLAAAGEPNTKAGRANFHKRFPTKQAFDAWYNPKKEYGGGLTDGIAFPQQPDASSNRAPYYEKGGFFAPNVMPWNGPIGFYEHGGLHKYQFAGNVQQFSGIDPDNYYAQRDASAYQGEQGFGNQGYDYEGPITRPGYVFPSPNTPYIPGLKLGEDLDRNPNMGVGIDDPRTRRKTTSSVSSSHHPSIGKQIVRWWQKNFQGKGGRKYDVARCCGGKCHEYGGMTDGIAFPQQPTDHINFSAFPWQPEYAMGGLPGGSNDMPCLECGGYMETGGTTQMDQSQYTNGMAQDFLSTISQFSNEAQPTQQFGNVQEAGMEAAYGTEVGNNQMSDFNSLDMNNINNTSLMENQMNQLKNQQSNSFTNLLNTPANMIANTYLKNPKYKTQTVGSGMTGPAASPAGTSNNWADTRSNMAAQQAASNMFKEYGGDFFQTGGNNVNYQNRVQDILMRGQAAPKFAPSKIQMPAVNQQQTTQPTQGTQPQYTPEQIAAFQAYMQQMQGQGNYAPSWQAQSKANMANDPAYLKYLQNMGIQDVKWNNKMGMFGPKSKGHITFRTYYDPKTGKTVTAPADKAAASGQPDAGQTMQKGPKGPGFIQNLIAKNKQRKADKISKKYPLTQQEIEQRPDLATTQQEKEMRPDFNPYNNPNVALPSRNKITGMAQPGSFFPQNGFAYGGYSQYGYGGAPQYNYGGYPQYAVGGEAEMTDDEIANYLAMGGTLEYLD